MSQNLTQKKKMLLTYFWVVPHLTRSFLLLLLWFGGHQYWTLDIIRIVVKWTDSRCPKRETSVDFHSMIMQKTLYTYPSQPPCLLTHLFINDWVTEVSQTHPTQNFMTITHFGAFSFSSALSYEHRSWFGSAVDGKQTREENKNTLHRI